MWESLCDYWVIFAGSLGSLAVLSLLLNGWTNLDGNPRMGRRFMAWFTLLSPMVWALTPLWIPVLALCALGYGIAWLIVAATTPEDGEVTLWKDN